MQRTPSFLALVLSSTALGFTAGLRSQIPLAVLARTANVAGPAFLRNHLVASATYLSAAGELVGDKMPFVPSRIEPGPLAGRRVFGSIAGATLAKRNALPLILGIATGAAGSLAGSYAGFHARSWLGRSTCIPDVVWACCEDAIAVTIGLLATRD